MIGRSLSVWIVFIDDDNGRGLLYVASDIWDTEAVDVDNDENDNGCIKF